MLFASRRAARTERPAMLASVAEASPKPPGDAAAPAAAAAAAAPAPAPASEEGPGGGGGPSVLEQRMKAAGAGRNRESFAERRARAATDNRRASQAHNSQAAAAVAATQKALADAAKQEADNAANGELVGEELAEFRERMHTMQQEALERNASMTKALTEVSKWIVKADPSEAIDEEHAAEIGAEPPPPDDGMNADQRKLTKRFSQGDETAARAKKRGVLAIDPDKVLGRKTGFGVGSADEEEEGADGRPLTPQMNYLALQTNCKGSASVRCSHFQGVIKSLLNQT